MKACQQPLSMVRARASLFLRPNACPKACAAFNLTNADPPSQPCKKCPTCSTPTSAARRSRCSRGSATRACVPPASHRQDNPTDARATQVNPTALAAVVRELRKERDALAAAASQAGGEPPRR